MSLADRLLRSAGEALRDVGKAALRKAEKSVETGFDAASSKIEVKDTPAKAKR